MSTPVYYCCFDDDEDQRILLPGYALHDAMDDAELFRIAEGAAEHYYHNIDHDWSVSGFALFSESGCKIGEVDIRVEYTPFFKAESNFERTL